MSFKTESVIDAADLKDGRMIQVPFGDGSVLLSRLGDEIYATSAFCTHYGAPLAKGILTSQGRIVCPWHGACYNVQTGDIEDAPAAAGLHCFKAWVDESSGKICVTANMANTKQENKARPPKVMSSESTKGKGVVIVGGGAGAWATVDSLRANGYKLPITILTKEPHVPIDRTRLSKMLITDVSKLQVTSVADLKIKFGVNVRTGVTVTAISLSERTVTVHSGMGNHVKDIEEYNYDQLVLAPGSVARRLPIDGAQGPNEGGKENVFTLRGISDAQRIDAAAQSEARVVVIGSSFISMELVITLAKRKLGSICVVGRDEVPFQAVLGKDIGKALMEFHKTQGITFHMRSTVSSIITSSTTPTQASGVVIENADTKASTTLEADFIVMGVGATPATDFLKGSGIEMRKDGGVIVDEYLRVKCSDETVENPTNVYAIGDIAVYPDVNEEGVMRRIEHWNVAGNHGRAVGKTIAGKPDAFNKVPLFWSSQGQQLRYCGYGAGYDEVIIHGELSELKFVAYYVQKGKVVAVASMQRDPIVIKASELLRLGLMPSVEELRDGKDLLEIDISSGTKGKAKLVL